MWNLFDDSGSMIGILNKQVHIKLYLAYKFVLIYVYLYFGKLSKDSTTNTNNMHLMFIILSSPVSIVFEAPTE